jgi:hypothetical protein
METRLLLVASVRGWYDAEKGGSMIELTEQQMQALKTSEAIPPRIVNPLTKETFILLRVDEYERLKELEYDDSPWSREEIQALAWKAGEDTGWEEYDDTPEKS